MVKTTITERIEKFDDRGKLVEKITREETSEDDTVYYPSYTMPVPHVPNIIQPNKSGNPWEPYCIVTAQDANNVKPV